MRKRTLAACLVLLSTVAAMAASCAKPEVVPTPKATSTVTPTTTATAALSAYEQWAKDFASWEKTTYDAAKKEGKVVWYTGESRACYELRARCWYTNV